MAAAAILNFLKAHLHFPCTYSLLCRWFIHT